MKPLLDVRSIQCSYREQAVVHDLSLHVNPGSLVALLGPSGCGKTTALRAIAGFEPITRGEILLGDTVMSRPGFTLPPEQRRLGMVFQDYALFPHMSVAENIAFGVRKQSAADQRQITQRLLKTVDLDGLEQRYPHELSGGQQQRVALARALAPQPRLILMDEPFSNLDVELRERLSIEVRDILKKEGIAAILVTHSQDEAFALGENVGVMYDGQILQWDTPFNLYHEPTNRFVADFVGQGVFMSGTVLTNDTIETEIGAIRGDRAYPWEPGSRVDILIRPDDVVADADGPIAAIVKQKAFKGAEFLYTLQLPTGNRLLSLFPSHLNYATGDTVRLRLDIQHLVAFPYDDSLRWLSHS